MFNFNKNTNFIRYYSFSLKDIHTFGNLYFYSLLHTKHVRDNSKILTKSANQSWCMEFISDSKGKLVYDWGNFTFFQNCSNVNRKGRMILILTENITSPVRFQQKVNLSFSEENFEASETSTMFSFCKKRKGIIRNKSCQFILFPH